MRAKVRNSSNGFSLLELMVVVIIVGALAGIALPRFFNTVEYIRSAEAVVGISAIRSSIERCYLETMDYSKCLFKKNPGKITNIDVQDPGDSPNAHFSYKKQQPPPKKFFSIIATRNSRDRGVEGDEVKLQQKDGKLKWSGTGAFSRMGN